MVFENIHIYVSLSGGPILEHVYVTFCYNPAHKRDYFLHTWSICTKRVRPDPSEFYFCHMDHGVKNERLLKPCRNDVPGIPFQYD